MLQSSLQDQPEPRNSSKLVPLLVCLPFLVLLPHSLTSLPWEYLLNKPLVLESTALSDSGRTQFQSLGISFSWKENLGFILSYTYTEQLLHVLCTNKK